MSGAAYPDRLRVTGVRLEGRHGALPGEQETPQRFEVDILVHASLAPAAESDELARTVDYRTLIDIARAVVEGPSVTLIETIADEIAEDVLGATDASVVSGVEVSVRKPDAPLDATVDAVEVTVVRSRG